MKASSIGQR